MTLHMLLIANYEEAFLLAMEQALAEHFRIRSCRGGKQALDCLRSETIDLVVLDLTLPEIDGITILELAAAEGIRPAVIAVAPLINDYVISCAERLNICYLMRTPCDMMALAHRVLDLSASLSLQTGPREAEDFVIQALDHLGFNSKHDGFSYLLDAVVRFEDKPGQSFTKELYPAVGKSHGRSGSLVERSIRSAMDAAWRNAGSRVWQRYFPDCGKRPVAAVFIRRMAQALTDWKAEAAAQ